MNPATTLAMLRELFGPKADAFAEGAGNAATLGFAPSIKALPAYLTEQDYSDALNQAMAARENTRQAYPYSYGTGELIAGMGLPTAKLKALGPVSNAALSIADSAAKAFATQSNERGATLDDAIGAAELGGGLQGMFENLPYIGKAVRGTANIAQEMGLGLKGSAMKKVMGKTKDKTILGKGYDQLKAIIASGKGDANAIQQANKILSSAENRGGAYLKLSTDEIKSLVKSQESLVDEISNAAKVVIGKKGPKPPPISEIKGKHFQAGLDSASGATSGGKIPLDDSDEALAFQSAYDKFLEPLTKFGERKLAGKGPTPTLRELLQRRKQIASSGIYDEAATSVKQKAGTAAINDINDAIEKTMQSYADNGLIDAAKVSQFKSTGKKAQELISLQNALSISSGDKDFLKRTSDALRAGISGGPISIGLYYAGMTPLQATIAGSAAATTTGVGALGAALKKVADAGEAAGPAIMSTGKSLATTKIPYETQPSEQMQTPIRQEVPIQDLLGDLAPAGQMSPASTTPAAPLTIDNLLGDLKPATAAPVAEPLAPQNLPTEAPVVQPTGAALASDPMAAYYKALAGTESSFNTKAQNPTSSAKGLFGLINGTAANLGVEDATDPAQAFAGIQALTQENQNRFKTQDPEQLYAAHFLGAPTYAAYSQGQPLNPDQQSWVQDFTQNALPRFQSQYQLAVQPTPEYAANSSVIDDLMKMYGQG